jgi:hypothetical protein
MLHLKMMVNALVGCDVLPAATHPTAAMLLGANSTGKYNTVASLSQVSDDRKTVMLVLGSIDLLDAQRQP